MKTSTLFVAVGAGPNDGIMSMGPSPAHQMPVVLLSEQLLRDLSPMLAQISRETGKTIQILKFTNPEIISEFHPVPEALA